MIEWGTMTNGFVTLRSKSTGKTGEYPERFLGFDDLELADPETASCVDCVVPVADDELDPEVGATELDPEEDFLVFEDDESDTTYTYTYDDDEKKDD